MNNYAPFQEIFHNLYIIIYLLFVSELQIVSEFGIGEMYSLLIVNVML